MGTTGHASNRTVDYGASSAAGVIMWQKLDQWMQMTVAAISFVSPERVLEVDKEKRWVDRAGNQIHDLRRISGRWRAIPNHRLRLNFVAASSTGRTSQSHSLASHIPRLFIAEIAVCVSPALVSALSSSSPDPRRFIADTPCRGICESHDLNSEA